MPIDLAGISNVNEFFSEHYLQTVFEGDVQELFREWRDLEKTGTTPPNRLLEKVGSKWRKLAIEYRSERNERERLLAFRRFAHDFLTALGYERNFRLLWDDEEKLVPVEATRVDAGGHDRVWVVEAISPAGTDFNADPLTTRFRCEQFENIDEAADIAKRRKDTPEAALNKGIFALRHPPRFVIILSMSQVVLVDREKWSDSRLLRFDLAEIFGRNEPTTLGTVAALLQAASLAPESGTALLDRIDEESHRHAYGVSQDLKFALRKAIELLGNEAAELIVEKRRAQQKGVFTGAQALDAGILSTECLRYMYRLLFLFYIEARPDLGFAPINAAAYASGYSLNSLRELELAPLETEEDRNGHFISDTIETLFRIVFDGTPASAAPAGGHGEPFTFQPVRARLFSPEAIGTYLGGLRFRNSVMQQVIELLSLSNEGKGRGRGRISYAQLGISQLGAVYESLLSFTGFFADEDLVELKPSDKSAPGPLEAAYFAPHRRAKEFEKDEIVYEAAAPKIYPRGTFIYRLAGRNRENSASYYTPEPLARMLVKYALKDLLEGTKKASDLLNLKVIEPAMGSAAFLVEVVNQLADKYLELRQAELGRRIPHEERSDVERRVRAYIADRNVFGVDLNPIAVELGQISLWLNCLHKGGFAPWFEDQLHNGNSLVGARRAAHPTETLMARREEERWYNRKPHEIGWSGEKRRNGEIWHFLLPDPSMSAYDQNTVRPLAPEAWKELQDWRREFMQPFERMEIDNLARISDVIDRLFDDVADRLADVRRSVNDDVAIWPAPPSNAEKHVDFSEKMKRLASFHGDGVRNAVSWKRLKTAMDAWCALWFWPVDKAHLLPARATFIADIALVIEGKMGGKVADTSAAPMPHGQGRLFETVAIPAKSGSGALFSVEDRVSALERRDLFGDVDVDALIVASSWLPTAMEVAAKQRFMHFDLEFADVMRERGGFDLVIGNPPWMRPSWYDPDVLSGVRPEYVTRNLSSSEVGRQKPDLMRSEPGLKEWYIGAYADVGGFQKFISSSSNFPYIATDQPNLYLCFVDLAFRLTSPKGISALIHQDTHLSEADGRAFRREWYRRVRRHYHFRNALTKKMFAEVSHRTEFSVNIYSGRPADEVVFEHGALLLLPSMVDDAYQHDGVGPVPGLKRADGEWETRGHRRRIVTVDTAALRTFAAVIEDAGCPPDESRFLFPFSGDTLKIFEALGGAEVRFSEAAAPYQMTGCFHEGGATEGVKPLLASSVAFADAAADSVLSSSQLYVGNPLYKAATSGKREPEILLDEIDADYVPRTYFRRNRSVAEFEAAIPRLNWDPTKLHSSSYRIAFRKMLSGPTERTLIASLLAPGFTHIDSISSLAFQDERHLLAALPLWISLPFDFLVKTTGLSNFYESTLRFFPWASVSSTAISRALRLSCVTSHYADLWNRHADGLVVDGWSLDDPRLNVEKEPTVRAVWSQDLPLRSDFARRLALVEIDVLVAQALGLSLDQLIEMYRTQFHVLEENERGTWYDTDGRIVWTCAKGIPGVGFRKADGKKPSGAEWLRDFAPAEAGHTLTCQVDLDFLRSGRKTVRRTFAAPFVTCDREADYRRAWAFFEAQTQKRAA